MARMIDSNALLSSLVNLDKAEEINPILGKIATQLSERPNSPDVNCSVLVSLLQKNSSSGSVVLATMEVLKQLALNPSQQSRLIDAKIAEEVLTLLADYLQIDSGRDVVLEACATLRYLCRYPSFQAHVADIKGLDYLLDVVKKFNSDEAVMEACLAAIHNLTLLSENQPLLLTRDTALETIVAVLSSHIANPVIAELGCRTLRNVCMAGNQECKVGAIGGANCAIHVLQFYGTSSPAGVESPRPNVRGLLVGVLDAVLRLIEALAFDADNRKRLGGEKGLQAILSTLLLNIGNASIVRAGLNALCRLAVSEANQLALTRMDGVPVIIRLIKEHPSCDRIADRGCATLRNIAMADNNETLIGRAGGVEAVLVALRQHMQSVHVVKSACAALTALECSVENQAEIAKEHGIESILEALRSHLADEEAAEGALAAIANITSLKAHQVLVAEAGGLAIILDALTLHRQHSRVVDWGCRALRNIAMQDKYALEVAAAGGVDLVIDLIAMHIMDVDVAESGCRALKILALNDQINVQIASAGGLGIFLQVIRSHPDEPEVVAAGIAGVKNMIRDNVQNQRAVVDREVLVTLIAAVRRHAKCVEVAEQACAIFRTLSLSFEFVDILTKVDASEVLMELLALHPTNSFVSEQGSGAISLLCTSKAQAWD